ncbi:MAG: HNH endonuclease [Desulfovibrio sp.]|nr:HNH endonuclease [Desulfovibrio sp.]
MDCRQDHTCCLCGKRQIEDYHHLAKASEGGSDLPENLIGVCALCHEKIHKGGLSTKIAEIKKKYHHLSVLNTAIPYITIQ